MDGRVGDVKPSLTPPSVLSTLAPPTCDAAEQAETRRAVSFVTVGEPLPREGRDWDRHGDGLVEFPSSGLHGNDGAEGCSVTQDFLHRVVGDRLRLRDGGVGGGRR